MRRDHFAWQHILKGRGRKLFFVITVIVSSNQERLWWLSGVSQCRCFLLPVISVLPFWNGGGGSIMKLSFAVPGIKDQLLGETATLVFLLGIISCYYWCTVTLTNYHPEMGFLHPVLGRTRLEEQKIFVDNE